ncbi:MAG: autotransporter outer membrane beta-barrel domain-containing protein [Burkholderiales bacterium]|nr:autotransporter outer membrane beta-barrel domain-containing protein [Burkholderiales bacterium]
MSNAELPWGRARLLLAAATAVFTCGQVGSALGQTNDGLKTLPGATPLQLGFGGGLQDVCVTITGTGPGQVLPNVNGTPLQRLSASCSRMAISAFANQPGGIPPSLAVLAPYNLMISNDEIATGVQAIAPVQANAQKQMSTEAAKMNTIGARLLDVRGGARGVVLDLNGNRTQLAGTPERGGGAAADSAFGGPWGGFVNVSYSWGNVDQTSVQDAYDYGSVTVLAGADYRVSDSWVVGGALGYTHTNSDYDFGLGSVKADTFSILGYATYYKNDWYVDAFLAWGDIGYDTTRNIFVPSNSSAVEAQPINTTATASPNGTQWSFAIGAGRNFKWDSYTITPTARLGYIWVKNDAFSEAESRDGLGLFVDERTIKSLQSSLGAKVSTVVSTSYGVFSPYFNAQWLHEFENDNPSIVSKYVNDPNGLFFAIPTAGPTRDYGVLTLGSSATLPNNVSGFFQFSAAVGLDNETNYGLVLGIRKQF